MKQRVLKKKHRNASRKLRHLLNQLHRILVVMAVISVVTAVAWLFYTGIVQRTVRAVESRITEQFVAWGFQLEHIYLEGQQNSQSQTILSALDARFGHPIFSLSLPKIKKHLESTEWVKHAIVERQFPNTLHIKIIEKQPIALWQHKKKLQVIDEEGQIIPNVDLGPFASLIILVGEDAPHHARSFLSLISDDQDIMKRVSSATRVGDRRWNVTFDTGLEVKLPEKNPERAWQQLLLLIREKKIFEEHYQMIDLRLPDRLYMTKDKQTTQKNKKA